MKLTKRKCTVTNVNARKEKHGEDWILAVDVAISITGTPKMLDQFDTTLRPDFYLTAEGKENVPKHPEITSFQWGREFTGSDLRLGDEDYKKVTLKKFVFSPGVEGEVGLTFTASWLPHADDVGPLAELMREDTTVSFATNLDLVDEAEGKQEKPPTKDGQPIVALHH